MACNDLDVLKIAAAMRSRDKVGFHRVGKKVLKELARLIGATEFNVRSCKGGPAVMGEVTLHTPKLYMQIGGERAYLMFRTCRDMKDYCGGPNQWASVENLASDTFIRRLSAIQRAPHQYESVF